MSEKSVGGSRDEANVLDAEDVVAKALGISVRTLQAWRVSGSGPKFVKLGRAVRYRRGDVQDFIQQHTVASTSAPVAA